MKDRKAPRKEPQQLDPESETWNKLPWRKLEHHVFRIQKRIFQASQRGNHRAVQKLQKLLMKSQSARLIATRRVTQDNQGKKTAGVDGVKSVPPQKRFALVEQIHPKQGEKQKAQPVRRVWIPKPGKAEQRPLGIPTMVNRCQQALVKLALEPEWEARFEPNSYGFRPGRSCHDAIEAIFKNISTKAKYVLDADIRGAFDYISHEALLQKLQSYPAVARMIKSWLKAGVIDKEVFERTERGTPQGGVISPLLMNIALHGMETALIEAYRDKEGRPQIVRYADDLVVFHPTEEGVKKARAFIETWLADMGLKLKPSKTRITHTLTPYQGEVGFDFLGFTIRHYPMGKYRTGKNQQRQPLGFKTFITPSKEARKRHMRALRQRMEELRGATQAQLIQELNPIIRGWSNYYRAAVSKATFRACDNDLYHMLKAWAKHRHSNKNMHWIINKYWGVNRGSGWSFETPKGLALARHGKVEIRRHVKVRGNASPYDGNLLYWSQRLKNHPLTGGTIGKLLYKQQGKCRWCGLLFQNEDLIEIDHITPRCEGGGEELSNKFALHRHCHDQRHAKKLKAGTYDKGFTTEEPGDGKPSRPVLQTSLSCEGTA